MPLQISSVERLEDVLGPSREFLSRDGDLFARPRIVVPNAGTKAWLLGRLARELGATGDAGGRSRCDGIVANVDFSYPGTILALLQPPRGVEHDPWDFDRLTFAVLDVLAAPAARQLDIPFDVHGEPLLAARRIAGLFDEYHVRRPEMILQWESDTPSRVMNPTANDEQRDGIPLPDVLAEQDRWQYELWRLVHRRIAAPSPPARASLAHRAPHAPLLVAGLQSLSWPQLHCLQRLAEHCEVRALLVHPSPGLRDAWTAIGPQPLEEKLRGLPLRRSRRKPGDSGGNDADEPALLDGFDPLPATWLAGARDMQDLLSAQGTPLIDHPGQPRPVADSLLGRLQETVATGRLPEPSLHDPAADHSVAIHRCHNLARQAEVLHDALLHAFADPRLAGLAPHDVVIVSPCLEQAAPHLEAVFQKTLGAPGDEGGVGGGRPLRLPLVVADRGLRETSPAVELLSRVVALPGSRCAVDDVLEVAGHPLVRSHLGIDDDTLKTWLDLVDRAQVRWGIDGEHRRHRGLAIGDPALEDVHTWKAGLEQMLLGATLPDEPPRPELGGVVPLGDLDPADIQPIATLVRVLDVVGRLASLTGEPRPAATWCDAIEEALTGMCGEQCQELTEPLAQLRRLREAAAGAAADRGVAFDEIRTLLAEWFEEQAGRQPLRTGAITATSMVPVRGVPFRVVCVIGYDDGVVATTDPPKDDLAAKMPLVGDSDPRIDGRRALLDCLLAARDRLVITCTGRSVKTNEHVPLVTPLAELVDFAVRHGVVRKRSGERSAIEFEHPRHHLGRRNFVLGQVQPGLIWSHDTAAARVAAAAGLQRDGAAAEAADSAGGEPGATAGAGVHPWPGAGSGAAEKPEIDIAVLMKLVRDPLALYLKHTFQIDIWHDDDEPTPATLPLALEERQSRTLTMELLDVLAVDPQAATPWRDARLRSGRLPLGPHGRRQLEEITLLAAGLDEGLREHGLSHGARVTQSLGIIPLGDCRLVGQLGGIDATRRQLAIVFAKEIELDTAGRPLHAAALQLLAARAAGIDLTHATIVSRRPRWKPGARAPTKSDPGRLMAPWQSRVVRLGDDLMTPAAATRRLTAIAGLLRDALAEPCPAFGTVITAEPQRREAAFADQLASRWYPRSCECLVFGAHPTFAAVYTPRRLAFLDSFQRLLEPVWSRNQERGYVLS